MIANSDDVEQLRAALEQAVAQRDHDRVTIDALRQAAIRDRREAQHQVRNVLSVVRSIARRTAEEGETLDRYRDRLDSRLASFTRLQSYILSDPGRGVDLCNLIADELLAFGIGLGVQAHVDGGSVCLKPKPASVLGLAFHELARMAIEDGQSSDLDGRIDVTWGLETKGGEPAYLTIQWEETGRPANFFGPKLNLAFGREVLEQSVTYDLGGTVQLDVTIDGLICSFRVPADCLMSWANLEKEADDDELA